jgi:hypothetical protein
LSLDSLAPTETIALPTGDAGDIAFATTFWDDTESLIKEAEQINLAMIVPAISELRYGGRKLIDYLRSLGGDDKKSQRTHLEDFMQCCIRARHDAVDAIVSYIVLYLEELERSISADLISEKFPGYDNLKRDLFASATLIAESRQDRERRNEIYSTIKKQYISEIVLQYRNLSSARSAIFAVQHKRDNRQHQVSWAIAIAMAFLASVLLANLLAKLV